MTGAHLSFRSRTQDQDRTLHNFPSPPSDDEYDICENAERPPPKRRRTEENLGDITISDNDWNYFEVQSWPLLSHDDPRFQLMGECEDTPGHESLRFSSTKVSAVLNPYTSSQIRSFERPVRSSMSPTAPNFPRNQHFQLQNDSKITRARRCSAPALVKSFSTPGEISQVFNTPGRPKPEPLTCEFIDDTRPFPKEQQWVRPEAAPRALIDMAALNSISTSPAPGPGESLSLEKHADRIAALIEQKRKANEVTSFRQKLLRKQMAHRGVPDPHEMMLSLSHDKLKRRMEASASGSLDDTEEPQEYSFEMIVACGEANSSPTRSVRVSNEHDQEDQNQQESDQQQLPPEGAQVVKVPASDSLSEPDQTQEHPIAQDLSASVSHYPSSSHNGYYQSTTKSMMVISTAEPDSFENVTYFPSQQLYLQDSSPVSITNTQQNHQNPYLEPWSTQLRQALPQTQFHQAVFEENGHQPASTATESNLTALPELNVDESSQRRTGWQHINIFSRRRSISSANAPSSGTRSVFTHLPSSLRSFRNISSRFHLPRPPILSSNMNMFTGHARENFVGISGGAPAGVTKPTRKNMFRN